jgi:hypothetical protein
MQIIVAGVPWGILNSMLFESYEAAGNRKCRANIPFMDFDVRV